MATSSCSRMLKLRSSEGNEFEIDETAAMVSELLKKIIEKGLSDQPITLPDVTGEVLSHVIEYCNKHSPEVEIRKWDADFVDLDMHTLYELRLAAIHMDINSLSFLLTDAIVAASRRVRLEREKLVHEKTKKKQKVEVGTRTMDAS
eukprot:TRINITY_DN20964_c0_g2_i1.p1 TRINITY_DN20964_c0_g2~~TRINITY_DN20964_c0_g2_i1.p1  ORF type:complete len:160 (-),score=24.08 TRINITY_DN20964_c0_g2_i1:403-840(-)